MRGFQELFNVSHDKIMPKQHFSIFGKWVKDVAFLILAGLVVQKIFAGVSPFSIDVVSWGIVSFFLYFIAVTLVVKSK